VNHIFVALDQENSRRGDVMVDCSMMDSQRIKTSAWPARPGEALACFQVEAAAPPN
jgi:hypothetical protein